jgi:aspartate carbamoyltransferase catalytic subunit
MEDRVVTPGAQLENRARFNGTLKHVIESQQFTVPLLMELFDRARGMERVVARGGTLDYQNRIMATLFYTPSTRTRLSFEAAMHRLGGRVLSTEHAREFSSEIEGENVEDTIHIIGSYSDRSLTYRSSMPEMVTAGSTRRRPCSTCTPSIASVRSTA